MGKNAMAKTKRKYGLDEAIMNRIYRELAKEIKEDTKAKFRKNEREIIIPMVHATAFLRMLTLGLLVNKKLFGHGKQRLQRFADECIFQYDCVKSGNVTIKDMVELVAKESGIRVVYSEEEMQLVKKYGIERGSNGVDMAFKELRLKEHYDGESDK